MYNTWYLPCCILHYVLCPPSHQHVWRTHLCSGTHALTFKKLELLSRTDMNPALESGGHHQGGIMAVRTSIKTTATAYFILLIRRKPEQLIRTTQRFIHSSRTTKRTLGLQPGDGSFTQASRIAGRDHVSRFYFLLVNSVKQIL